MPARHPRAPAAPAVPGLPLAQERRAVLVADGPRLAGKVRDFGRLARRDRRNLTALQAGRLADLMDRLAVECREIAAGLRGEGE
jgi:hypothetical protein